MRIGGCLVLLAASLPLACGDDSSGGGESCDAIAAQIDAYVKANTDPLGEKTIPRGRENNACFSPVPAAVFASCEKLAACRKNE